MKTFARGTRRHKACETILGQARDKPACLRAAESNVLVWKQRLLYRVSAGQKQMSKTINALAIAVSLSLTVLIAAAGQVQAEVAFTLSSPNAFRNNIYAFAHVFTVGEQDLTVNALGAFDANGDGFVTSGGIPVGIFRESDQSLLTSTNVVSSDPLAGNFRFGDISALTLTAGEQYRVVAVNGDDEYNIDNDFSTSSFITFDAYGFVESNSLIFFNQTISGPPKLRMGNLDFAVPEPSTLLLSLIGLALLPLWRRNLRRCSS